MFDRLRIPCFRWQGLTSLEPASPASASVGIGHVFLDSVDGNPSLAKQLFGYAILGFALMMAFFNLVRIQIGKVSFTEGGGVSIR